MNQSYATRLAQNKTRLIALLAMRRAGKTNTAAYRSLKRLAMQQYYLLTLEACQRCRVKINNAESVVE